MPKTDFRTDHLNDEQRKIANIVTKVIKKFYPDNYGGGGCTAFRSPEELKASGETLGTQSVLILCHDGGDLASFCNYDYCDYTKIEALAAALDAEGYELQNCHTWYSAVYKKSKNTGFRDSMLARANPDRPGSFCATIIDDRWSEEVTQAAVRFIPDNIDLEDETKFQEHVQDVLNAYLVYLVLTHDTEWIVQQIQHYQSRKARHLNH